MLDQSGYVLTVLVAKVVVAKVDYLKAGIVEHVRNQQLHVVSLVEVAGLADERLQRLGLTKGYAHLLPSFLREPVVDEMEPLEHWAALNLLRKARAQIVVQLGVLRDAIVIGLSLWACDFHSLELLLERVVVLDVLPDVTLVRLLSLALQGFLEFVLDFLQNLGVALVRVNHEVFNHVEVT